MTPSDLPAIALAVEHSIEANTCTSRTVDELRRLLGLSVGTSLRQPASVTKARKDAAKTPARTKANPAKSHLAARHEGEAGPLAPAASANLATKIVNSSLKVLTVTVREQIDANHGPPKASNRNQPLQPRSPNQQSSVTDSPKLSKVADAKTASQGLKQLDDHVVSLAECSRAAFECLRQINESRNEMLKGSIGQIELGMSSLIGKLLALGMDSLASKELRSLIPRLQAHSTAAKAVRVKNASTSQREAPLTDLLLCNALPGESQALEVLIASHIQILKLVSKNTKTSITERTLSHLDGTGISIFTAIEARLALKTPGIALKASKWLDQIAQALDTLASARTTPETSKSFFHVAFRCRILACRTRLRSLTLNDSGRSIQKYVLDPFTSCVSALAQDRNPESAEKYLTIKEGTHLFLQELERFKNDQLPPHLYEQTSAKVYRVLADVARESRNYNIAFEWLEKALQIPSASSCVKCALGCLLASTHIQQALSGHPTNSLSKVLRNTSDQLKQNLQGSATDMDDVFVSAASLRKQAMSMLMLNSSKAESSQPDDVKSTNGLCEEIILRCVNFFIRYAQGIAARCKDQREKREERQYGLIAKSLVPTVEALAAITKISQTRDTTSWDSVLQCLQECQALVPKFRSCTDNYSSSQQQSRHPLVTISNGFWSRYLKRKSQGSEYKELASLLKHAIDALSSGSPLTQDAGFLYLKLEKLGGLLESRSDLDGASSRYGEALRAILATPSANEAFEKSDPFLEITSRPQTGSLARLRPLIASYMRVQAKLTTDSRRAFVPFHPQLQPASDGCMLELQLTIALESVKADFTLLPNDAFGKLYELVKESYALATTPLQRVHLKLLRGLCLAPACYPAEFLDTLQEKHAAMSLRIGEQDDAYQHSKDQYDMYMVLLKKDSKVSRMSDILSSWQRQLKSFEQFSDNMNSFASPEFLYQLQLLQDYLIFDGNEASLAQVTDILLDMQKHTGAPTDLVQHSAIIAQQLTRLGHCELARKFLSQTEMVVEHSADGTQISYITWHLAYAEYLLDIGNTEKCNEKLLLADRLSTTLWPADEGATSTLWSRYQQLYYTAQILHLKACLSKVIGNPAKALYCAKKSTRRIHRAWAVLERHQSARSCREVEEPAAPSSASRLDNIADAKPIVSTEHSSLKQASFWSLGPLLYAHTAKLAYLLTDEGQLLEARYYAEKADKVARAIGSARLLAETVILKTHLTQLAGESLQDVSSLQGVAAEPFGLCSTTQADTELALAEALHKGRNLEAEVQALKQVELILAKSFHPPPGFSSPKSQETDTLSHSMAALSIQPQAKGNGSRSQGKGTTRKPKKDLVSTQVPSKTNVGNKYRVAEHGPLIRRQVRRLLQSALLSLQLKDFDLAATVLQEAKAIAMLPIDSVTQALCNTALSIYKTVSVLAKDPVFSLVQESSIMHPSVSAGKDSEAMTRSNTLTSGNGNKPAASTRGLSLSTKSQNGHDELVEILNASSQYLIRISRNMQSHLTTTMGHVCSDLLLKAQLLLSITASSSPKATIAPASLAYSLEYGRCLAYVREQASIAGDRLLDMDNDTPTAGSEDLLGEDLVSSRIDVSIFQSTFVDIIPPQWSVISISVSADHEELRVSRMRALHSPMILSIPLSRHNPRDCEDEEPFGFDEGKAELLEIISLANYSAHEGVDLSKKGAKTAWWETRAALDARLNDLINNVQNMWIGGFQGIFSQHVPSLDLMARFQTTLNNIMNKHLPSRQQTKKGAATELVCLDTHVLELFVGLGHPTTHEDMDTALLDLFYFVVDILQFHGERNAYDEIDFDPMIIETIEALTHYHNAAAELQDSKLPKHTILVLDKCLHAFPWESLPCLNGQSVSRVPSLNCLRDRILMQQEQGLDSSAFRANTDSGSYILNPSGDLASTHKTFGPSLSGLTSWDATVKSLPSETDITTALSRKSLYLYFGHGSGAQYVRSRAIRRLKQCAVALLMGCSSGSLIEAGELESHGPLMAYLHAGSPAVVGTLWDVTDKDIDRFAMNTLEKWGLFEAKPEASEKGKGRKGKGKARAEPVPTQHPVSLDQAVAESRQSCILRYLNGAAPVVYGIPVVLK